MGLLSPPTQKQECKTIYRKDCYIETRMKSSLAKVEVCYSNFVRQCGATVQPQDDEEQVCTKEHDTGEYFSLQYFSGIRYLVIVS